MQVNQWGLDVRGSVVGGSVCVIALQHQGLRLDRQVAFILALPVSCFQVEHSRLPGLPTLQLTMTSYRHSFPCMWDTLHHFDSSRNIMHVAMPTARLCKGA
jgi:hypothetical protein